MSNPSWDVGDTTRMQVKCRNNVTYFKWKLVRFNIILLLKTVLAIQQWSCTYESPEGACMPKIPLFFKKLFCFGLQGNGKLNLHNFSLVLKKPRSPPMPLQRVATPCVLSCWEQPLVLLLTGRVSAFPALPLTGCSFLEARVWTQSQGAG